MASGPSGTKAVPVLLTMLVNAFNLVKKNDLPDASVSTTTVGGPGDNGERRRHAAADG